MVENNKKKVLVVGSGAAAYAVSKKFSEYDNIEKVYVACGNPAMKEFAEVVDIREDSINELLVFALENAIDLTIAISPKAIKADIAGIFQENSQQIFAPVAKSAEFALSKSFARKLLYKHHIPTPRFGIFEKPAIAMDYLKKVQMPVVISSDENTDAAFLSACSTVDFARTCIDDMAMNDEGKIIIDEFVYGHNFTTYVITDGYHVLPLAVSADYKFLENGDGGLLTCGMGAFVPDYKISSDVINVILSNVKNILSSFENSGNPYMGILGVDCVLLENGKFVTTGFTPFMKEHDAQAVINAIGENLYTLFEACCIGSFADDYESVKATEISSVAAVLYSRTDGNIINGLDKVDDSVQVSYFTGRKNDYLEDETNRGRTLVLTAGGATLSSARKRLYENIDTVEFAGKKYRTDICL